MIDGCPCHVKASYICLSVFDGIDLDMISGVTMISQQLCINRQLPATRSQTIRSHSFHVYLDKHKTHLTTNSLQQIEVFLDIWFLSIQIFRWALGFFFHAWCYRIDIFPVSFFMSSVACMIVSLSLCLMVVIIFELYL